jgi:hypothetical protein
MQLADAIANIKVLRIGIGYYRRRRRLRADLFE